MADFPSYSDLFRVARDEVLSRSNALTRTVVEREGTDANALTAAGAAVGDECIAQLTQVQAALFLDSAKKDKLDRLIFDRYQLLRKPASPAVVPVQFSTIAPAGGAFSIPAGTKISTTDGKAFLTQADTPFPAGSSGPIIVNTQSALSGLSQAVRIGQITSVTDAIIGAPADLQVTNTVASSLADDEESDDDYTERGRNYYATARRGTLRAIEQGALSVAGVRKATAFEAIDPSGQAARSVQLVVSDAFTEQLVDATVVPSAYQTQAQTIAATIQAGLSDIRAAGIPVAITLATVILLDVSLALRFQAGVSDPTTAAVGARSAVVAYVNSLPPGAPFVVDDAVAALGIVPGVIASTASIISPAGDVVVTPLQVLRTYLGRVLTISTGVS